MAEEDLTEAEDELPVLRRMVEKSFASTKKQLAALIKPVPPKNWLDKVAVEAYQNRVDEWKGEYEGAIDLMKTGQQMYSDLKGEIGQLTVAALAAQLDLTIATRAAQLASVQHDAKAAQAEARALEEERLEDARRREARKQRFAAKEAESREKLAAIEWRIAWLARPSVLCETPAETRARLEADAERVWGSNWRDRACMDTDQ